MLVFANNNSLKINIHNSDHKKKTCEIYKFNLFFNVHVINSSNLLDEMYYILLDYYIDVDNNFHIKIHKKKVSCIIIK